MKKTLIFIFIIVTITIYPLYSQYGGGNGTMANPYQISTLAHLNYLANQTNTIENYSNGKYFILMNDISTPFTNVIGTVIGTIIIPPGIGQEIRSFSGDFNGNNKKITLNINRGADYIGLFGYIKDANIYDLIVDGNVSGSFYVGGIVGYADGNNVITNCKNYANVDGRQFMAGIVGQTYNGPGTTVTNCVNYGNITSVEGHAAGIVGCCYMSTGTTIKYCVNVGTIKSTNMIGVGVAGIAGHIYDTDVSYCLNIGTIIGVREVGGISGGGIGGSGVENRNSITANCINAGSIICNNQIGGGIIGNRAYATVKNCISTGAVIEGNYIGGIAGGRSSQNSQIENCYYDKQMCVCGGINGNDVHGQSEGRLTKEMVGDSLEAFLGDTDWEYLCGIYPQLKSILDLEETASNVGASPVFIYDLQPNIFDRQNQVQHYFRVSTANNVNWSSKNNRVQISQDEAVLLTLGYDTLEASIGTYKKQQPINITNRRQDFTSVPFCDPMIIAWDSVYANVGDTVSLTASVISVDVPRSLNSINFNINLDYKLFHPLNLYLIDSDNNETPINFTYNYTDGINATITNQTFSEPQRWLRLEGICLLSNPTLTPVSFAEFIPADNIILLDGLLEIARVCAGEFRSSLIFNPIYEVEVDAIIINNLLNLDFVTTGEVAVDVEIIDISGNTIYSEKLNLAKGNVIKQIKFNNFEAGIYFIKIENPFNPPTTKQIVFVK